jgi:hypothetical protein
MHDLSEVLKCELCEHVAMSKESLKIHCKAIHEELSEPRLRCNECIFTTVYKNILKLHMKRHNKTIQCNNSEEQGNAFGRRSTNVTNMSDWDITTEIQPEMEDSFLLSDLKCNISVQGFEAGEEDTNSNAVSEAGEEDTISNAVSEAGEEDTISNTVSEAGDEDTISNAVSEEGEEDAITNAVSEAREEDAITNDVSEAGKEETISNAVSLTLVEEKDLDGMWSDSDIVLANEKSCEFASMLGKIELVESYEHEKPLGVVRLNEVYVWKEKQRW